MPTSTQNESAQSYVADPRNDDVLVYVNGQMPPRSEASVSVFDSGIAFGMACVRGCAVSSLM